MLIYLDRDLLQIREIKLDMLQTESKSSLYLDDGGSANKGKLRRVHKL